MLRPKRFGWLWLGLILWVTACGSPSTDSQAELAEITLSEPLGTLDSYKPAENVPTEGARLAAPTTPVEMVAPNETEIAPTGVLTVSVRAAPTQGEPAPSKASMVEVDVNPDGNGPVRVGANSGPSEEQLKLLASLENLGAAPELPVNQVWLNSEPRELADLRGKVVMVEFWTFG